MGCYIKKVFIAYSILLASGVFGVSAQTIDSLRLLDDIRILSSAEFAGRKPGTSEHQKSVDLILERFEQLGLSAYNGSYISEFAVNDSVTGKNLIAYIPGQSEQAIVISGHYDHVGVRNGQIYYGADDNASGASALLAIAAYYAGQQLGNMPKHTLIFAAFDAEEMGLRGARYFVEEPPIPLENIVLNVNMDMVSRNDQNRLVASGTYHTPNLIPYIESTKNEWIQLVLGYDEPGTGRNDWTMQSDQGAFHRKGIPFIYFGVEDHPDYHTPNDTFERIQPRFFYQSVTTILEVIRKIDQHWSPAPANHAQARP